LSGSSKVRWGLATTGVLAIVLAVGWWQSTARLDPTNPSVTLSDIETRVDRRFGVPELTDAALVTALATSGTVLFDVREADEYEQSHLQGATRIDPGMSADAFLATYGRELRGRTVVFYCAVGVRSGLMLARVRDKLASTGATAAYNLRGGIFRWHASGRPLVAQSGPAATVHSYDPAWEQLLNRTLPDHSRPTLGVRP
jgi:rhodanese-related sulfurtransferase